MSHSRKLGTPPELVAVHRQQPESWPFLLDSASGSSGPGRWSMLLRVDQGTAPVVPVDGEFLPLLDREWHRLSRRQPGRLPFEGGWFLYLGYELAGEIEPRLQLPAATDGLPVAWARRCSAAVIRDATTGDCHIVAESPKQLDEIERELAEVPPETAPSGAVGRVARMTADDGERFKRGVARIRDYVLAGDVFQVNLSRAWQGIADVAPDPVAVYSNLARRNPAPFAGLARLPGGTLLSSSPERLVSTRGETIEVRPIAGTRPRGASPEQDRALSTELLAHPKERAEHIMLIDLVRNDLGRICEPGSVEVDELMTVESYAHVHHIVSNVRGRACTGTSPTDVIRAVFPGGTITGCPKVRCMEIIAELESAGRGFYTGSMGYLNLDGRLDLNILIRSMLISGDRIRFRTGAGIVADSVPEAELAETEAKAHGLMRALGSVDDAGESA